MTNYETITRADRHYLTLMNHTRADLNAALDYVCSAFAHNPERAISESNQATVAAIDAINRALKALNAPRPVRKYRVKLIKTKHFYAVHRKNGTYAIRRYGTTIPRICDTITDAAATINQLQLCYDRDNQLWFI